MTKRIRFTKKELEIINSMAAIASAAPWGEGDYQSWDETYTAPYDSLREKIHILLERTHGA